MERAGRARGGDGANKYPAVTQETLLYLLQAAASLSGLPSVEVETLPPIVMLPHDVMMARVCKGEPEGCEQTDLAAAFSPTHNEIVALESFDFDNDEVDASFLVHEIVHALQHRAMPAMMDSCESVWSAEIQAYSVQNAYLKSHGQMYQAGAALRFFHCD